MSLSSKYTIMKNFNKRLIKFKNFKPTKSETQLKKEQMIKNVEDYDNGDELNWAKNKRFDYKQFEIVDKADKEAKIDGETKKFIKEIKEREKGVDNREFSGYFNYEPSALASELSSPNTQYLKKGLDEIKQKMIELNKDERNSTNNKNENDRLNTILSVIDRIYQFFKYKFLSKLDKQSDRQQQITIQQQRNQDLRLWVTSTDYYANFKNDVNKYYETNFTYSAENKEFNLNNLKNFLISVNSQQATSQKLF